MGFHQAYSDYFKGLATSTIKIGHTPTEKHFVELDLDEVNIAAVGQLHYPAMILEGDEFKVGGISDDQIHDEYYGSFIILVNRTPKSKSIKQQRADLDLTQNIAQLLMARMRYDAHQFDGNDIDFWQHFNIRECEAVRFITKDFIGYRVEFTFRHFHNYELDTSEFSDL